MTVTIDQSEGVDALERYIGQLLGVSNWHTMSQERIQEFADVTGDQQWIHVDVERATREGSFGGPIAHGFFTLATSPELLAEIIQITGYGQAVNYGLNKVRWPAPVPAGSKVRMRATLKECDPLTNPDGVQLILALEFEVEGGSKPVCVADVIFRYYK